MDQVGIGVVGVGNIAALDVPGYLDHPGCRVAALCDPRREVLDRRCTEWNVPRGYADIEDLLADPAVDAVEILTPTYLHVDHVLAAVSAGKHVSVQKPIANTVADARRMADTAAGAGVVFRVNEHCCHYPPLVRARELVAGGAIGTPTVLRIKTVVGRTTSQFQSNLDPAGYGWRFDARSPGGHLFDDIAHKYAMALWLLDAHVTAVQAVVRRNLLFFEAPTVAIWEYDRADLLGMMEVSYAPNMFIRSKYWGADEFFEIQGTDGFVWVTRLAGELHDLPPILLYTSDGHTTTFADVDADYRRGHELSAAAFVDAVHAGAGAAAPDLAPGTAIEALQLGFAVYQASAERRRVDPSTIETSYSPPWWPPTPDELETDVKKMFGLG